MKILIYLCCGLIPVFLLVTYIIFGRLPASLSETYYMYKRKFGIIWPFKALLWILVAMIMPVWFEASDGEHNSITFLAFLSCVSLCSVAIEAEYLGRDEKTHQIFTGVAFILSLLWSVLIGQFLVPLYLYSLVAVVVVLGMIFIRGSFLHKFTSMKGLLLFECAAFYTIFFSILMITK